MCVFSACLAAVFLCSVNDNSPDDAHVKKLLTSENYTVTWETVPVYAPEAELDIGDGNGHGGTLGWIRFQPGKNGVDVLSIQFDEGWRPYKSKWPPDRASVSIKCARLKSDAYAALLHNLAVVDSAKLKPIEGSGSTSSSNDFWVYAYLTSNKKTLLELNWAGYEGSMHELDFAKPQAVVRLAREAIEGLDFRDHTLTDRERAWASGKFARDWQKFKGAEFHWWVRERYIETIGVTGDGGALQILRDILAAEPTKGKRQDDDSDKRCIYYAINAATRLIKIDVRNKPVEEMDIEKTRKKVLDLIKEKK